MSLAVLGVWQREYAGAFIYGLFLVSLDLAFSVWRVRRGRRMPPSGIGAFLWFSFLARISIFLAGMAVAVLIFGPGGRFVVGLTILSSVPLGILAAKSIAGSKEG
ncbi:MAG: hypothetical protein K6U03_09360 [Firmicutes bacterium]|nr:hypothetical protein [Bacillota bacterium]